MPCERSLAHAPTCLGTTSRLVGDRTDWGKVSIADTRGNRLSNKLFYCFLSEAQEESHSVSAGNEVSQKHGFRKPSIASIAMVSPSLILPPKREKLTIMPCSRQLSPSYSLVAGGQPRITPPHT